MSTRRRQYLLTMVAALGGLVLFAYAVSRVGAAPILASLRHVGWGFTVIIALAGLRLLARTEAWRLCAPSGSRLAFAPALAAFVAGDAVGNVTPLGLAASEPAKVLMTRRHVETAESIASLALENLVYSGSVLVVIAVGIVVLLQAVALPRVWQARAIAGLLALAGVGALGWRLMRRRRTAGPEAGTWRRRLQRLHDDIVQFTAAQPARVGGALTFDLGFHALAVLEAYLTLRWLPGGHSTTLSEAIVFEALNRVITVAFKFVPFRVGVDEALSGAFAPLLAVSPMAGVSLAVVRKVRNLCWAAVGLSIIAAHPVRAGRATDRRGIASVHRT
jgi:hypothetical protein